MKTKKPRSAKAAKPARRAVRRVTRKKPRTLRRKTSPAKPKRAASKRPRKPASPIRRRTRAPARTKRLRRPVTRRLRTRRSPIPAETEQLKIPELLLEEDESTALPLTGPGQKYALGPTPPTGQSATEEAGLPAAYGTGRLLLAARDPHWLYTHWDLTPQQQRRYNALSADRHLVVRIYSGPVTGRPVTEVHVHPESRHWFIHVAGAETQYVAQLGYYQPDRDWVAVATSAPAATPADAASADQEVRFATIPAHARLTRLAALAKQAVPAGLPPLTAARERALAELVALHAGRQEAMSSVEAGQFARPAGQDISAAQAGPLGGEAGSPTSPMGAAERPPAGFWFNVNAELVIYGATEPSASVTLGGRSVQLRPDGTFSCRFALPDGEHSITASAMSAQGDLRQAELQFNRRTDFRSETGAAPTDPSLKPPAAESS